MKFWKRKRFEDEMEAEMRFHMEEYAAALERSGVAKAEAERRARVEFGSTDARKDECREAWGYRWLDEVRADLRLTFRTLRRNPGFAAVAVLSLGLGIGATTAVFGVFDAVMLRTMPVKDPGGLSFVRMSGTEGMDGPPYPMFEIIRDQAKSFAGVAALSPSGMEVSAGRGRELLRGVWVSDNFYELLGVNAVLGRRLAAGDTNAAVISQRFWQERFGGDPAVIGRRVQFFQNSVTIVGVMPSEVMGLSPGTPFDIAAPMALSSPEKMRDQTALWLEVVARRKPGASETAALAELNGLFRGYMSQVRISEQVREMLYQRMTLRPAGQGFAGLRQQFAGALNVLLVLAGLVLAAACVNLTTLLLARASARQREFAVRLAIGAGRGRLIRQTLTEALVLVVLGAVVGLWVAEVSQAALAAYFAEGNRQIILDLGLSLRVLLFTTLVALMCGLAFGMAPALRAGRMDPAEGLKGASRTQASSRHSNRLGRALVVVQVALSAVLLAGAGLFVRSLSELKAVDPGFRREGILAMEAAPERHLFGTPEWQRLQVEILEEVRRIPGVRSAGWATMNPMSGRGRGAMVAVEGFAARTEQDKRVHLAAISPTHFETLGVPMLLGRGFTERDTATSTKVVIINESAARFYFGKTSPIGRRIRFTNYPEEPVYEVVGVARDVKHNALTEEKERFTYVPLGQSLDRVNRLALSVLCSGDPARFAPVVRQTLQAAGGRLLVTDVNTMEKMVAQTLLKERLVAALSSTFGLTALVLAGIGLYGVLAYAVTRRTNEIGIRMALGASRGRTVWMIVRESLVLTVCGLGIGLPCALLVGEVSQTLLYGVGVFDTAAYAAATMLLLSFAALAAASPSRKASRLDPVAALRRE